MYFESQNIDFFYDTIFLWKEEKVVMLWKPALMFGIKQREEKHFVLFCSVLSLCRKEYTERVSSGNFKIYKEIPDHILTHSKVVRGDEILTIQEFAKREEIL